VQGPRIRNGGERARLRVANDFQDSIRPQQLGQSNLERGSDRQESHAWSSLSSRRSRGEAGLILDFLEGSLLRDLLPLRLVLSGSNASHPGAHPRNQDGSPFLAVALTKGQKLRSDT